MKADVEAIFQRGWKGTAFRLHCHELHHLGLSMRIKWVLRNKTGTELEIQAYLTSQANNCSLLRSCSNFIFLIETWN